MTSKNHWNEFDFACHCWISHKYHQTRMGVYRGEAVGGNKLDGGRLLLLLGSNLLWCCWCCCCGVVVCPDPVWTLPLTDLCGYGYFIGVQPFPAAFQLHFNGGKSLVSSLILILWNKSVIVRRYPGLLCRCIGSITAQWSPAVAVSPSWWPLTTAAVL